MLLLIASTQAAKQRLTRLLLLLISGTECTKQSLRLLLGLLLLGLLLGCEETTSSGAWLRRTWWEEAQRGLLLGRSKETGRLLLGLLLRLLLRGPKEATACSCSSILLGCSEKVQCRFRRLLLLASEQASRLLLLLAAEQAASCLLWLLLLLASEQASGLLLGLRGVPEQRVGFLLCRTKETRHGNELYEVVSAITTMR